MQDQTHQLNTCSKQVMETLEQGIKYVQNQQWRQ